MTNFSKLNKTAIKLITSAGALALMAGFNPALVQTAHAYDCLLDTNDDGNADSNVDTDGGANSAGSSNIACGVGASAAADGAVAMGRSANASGDHSTALGFEAIASENHAVAVGQNSDASASGAIALGYLADADAFYAVALGQEAEAGNRATAAGFKAIASTFFTTALGSRAVASDQYAVAVGAGTITGSAQATGEYSIALGGGNGGSGDHGAKAAGEAAIAIGRGSKATLENAVAIGRSAIADHAGSIVIGSGDATEDGQIILGGADNFTIMGNGDMALGTGAPAAFADLQISRNNGVIIHLDDNTPSTGIPWNIQNTAGEFRLTTPPGGGAEKEFVLDADGNLTITGDMSSAQSLLRNSGAVFNKLTDTSTGTVWNFANIGSEARIVSPTVPGVEFRMDVNGNVTIMGSITTGGMTCGGGCDAVFSEDYDLPSIEEHAKSMFANKHLPAIGATSPNTPVNLSDQYGNLLNELEKAHIYIAQMNADKLALQEEQQALKLRLARLEALLIK